jgi:hypothetical protein
MDPVRMLRVPFLGKAQSSPKDPDPPSNKKRALAVVSSIVPNLVAKIATEVASYYFRAGVLPVEEPTGAK